MIEKLDLPSSTYRGGSDYLTLAEGDVRALLAKLNEVIEVVNQMQGVINGLSHPNQPPFPGSRVVSHANFITIENAGASG